MTAQLTLPTCCLPTCTAVVDHWGAACDTCIQEFGTYLAPVERRPDVTDEQIADELAERDRGTMQAYTEQAAVEIAATEPDPAVHWLAKRHIEKHITMAPQVASIVENTEVRKANQLCWVCEERHTCTREQLGWACDRCREIV